MRKQSKSFIVSKSWHVTKTRKPNGTRTCTYTCSKGLVHQLIDVPKGYRLKKRDNGDGTLTVTLEPH